MRDICSRSFKMLVKLNQLHSNSDHLMVSNRMNHQNQTENRLHTAANLLSNYPNYTQTTNNHQTAIADNSNLLNQSNSNMTINNSTATNQINCITTSYSSNSHLQIANSNHYQQQKQLNNSNQQNSIQTTLSNNYPIVTTQILQTNLQTNLQPNLQNLQNSRLLQLQYQNQIASNRLTNGNQSLLNNCSNTTSNTSSMNSSDNSMQNNSYKDLSSLTDYKSNSVENANNNNFLSNNQLNDNQFHNSQQANAPPQQQQSNLTDNLSNGLLATKSAINLNPLMMNLHSNILQNNSIISNNGFIMANNSLCNNLPININSIMPIDMEEQTLLKLQRKKIKNRQGLNLIRFFLNLL